MADEKEFLAAARFQFTSDDIGDDLYVQKISGIKMTVPVVGNNSPFGVAASSKVGMQQAPSAVKSEEVTITFVTNSAKPKAVSDWFFNSHPDRETGGATQTKGQLKTADIKVFKQDGTESVNWHFEGVMPMSYKMSNLDATGNQPLTETVTFAYMYVQRVK